MSSTYSPGRRRGLAVVAVGVAAAIALAGCSSGSNASSSTQQTTLKWAIASAPRALDTYGDFSSNAEVVDSLVYQNLVTLKNLKLEPSIAKSWKATDSTHYVYELDPDATFSDGNPVTADDVAYSFNRMVAEGSTSQAISHFKTLKSVAVTGDHEVTVTLTQPDATWIYDPLFAPIVEKSVVEKAGSQYGAPGSKIIGSGAYKVDTYSADSGIKLTLNQKFWGKKPAIKEVDFSYIADPSSLALALRSGDVDGSFGISLSQISQFSKLDGVNLVEGDGLSVVSLMMDLDTKPFDDIHVRKAFAYAWDAKSFVNNVLDKHADVANAITSPGFWTNLTSDSETDKILSSVPSYSFDMTEAKKELAESSVPDGFSTSISYPDSRPELGQALQVLAQNLKKLGITLTVKEIPYAQWVTLISAHKDLTIQIAQWNPDYPDPSDFIVSQYLSTHAVENQYNLSNYKNPEVDKLINQELASSSDSERATLMQQVLQKVAADVPNVNMYWPHTVMAIRGPFTYSNYNGLYYSGMWVDNISQK
ncbi:ABC transporter substrate-binding protein [Gryllotalpicola ginsengisoli]|uniref:ABC transporter substrate-binding protein n=1 Tax=Gryllotalpicola ginsengisoli TaxID=444608 RepID=UPI0003B2E576|nr:ABC transporter substrate-binding protein [Gryllotalpicola ginsengisoli]